MSIDRLGELPKLEIGQGRKNVISPASRPTKPEMPPTAPLKARFKRNSFKNGGEGVLVPFMIDRALAKNLRFFARIKRFRPARL